MVGKGTQRPREMRQYERGQKIYLTCQTAKSIMDGPRWMDPGLWYGSCNEGHNKAMDIDDDERAKDQVRWEWKHNERETDCDWERDMNHDYQQEMGKWDYHVQQVQHQHQHGPSLQHQHVHPMTLSQRNHHHSAKAHHHHHQHHVLHCHHGQRPMSIGQAGHGTSTLPPSLSRVGWAVSYSDNCWNANMGHDSPAYVHVFLLPSG